jgi:hypothetical protein
MMRAALFVAVMAHASPSRGEDRWVYLDNGALRLGVNKTAGACIGFLSSGKDHPNVLNSYDRGRFVQQSYYGDKDGSFWDKTPWRFNPVQGGHWQGKPAQVLDFKSDETTLYSRTQPVHWATGHDLSEIVMEQWIRLSGPLAHVRFRMEYKGSESHAAHDQEIPAFFVQPEYGTLVLYGGGEPWTGRPLTRRRPSFPNESAKLTERWAAWVNGQDHGVGLYVPATDRATCYRYGDGAIRKDSCSYIAPLKTFALTPGHVWEYEAWMTIGTVDEIRGRFQALHEKAGDGADPDGQKASRPSAP